MLYLLSLLISIMSISSSNARCSRSSTSCVSREKEFAGPTSSLESNASTPFSFSVPGWIPTHVQSTTKLVLGCHARRRFVHSQYECHSYLRAHFLVLLRTHFFDSKRIIYSSATVEYRFCNANIELLVCCCLFFLLLSHPSHPNAVQSFHFRISIPLYCPSLTCLFHL